MSESTLTRFMKSLIIATIVGLFALLAQRTYGWEPIPSFIAYIKQVEGFRSTPYYCAAGKLTIGYGHQIKAGEVYTVISESEATVLLAKDLKAAYGRLNVKKQLTNRQVEMLTDFSFQLGSLSKFPKFKQAVLDNSLTEQRAEYKRYAAGKELKGRNTAFYNRYLR